MNQLKPQFGVRRVYGSTHAKDGAVALRLSNQEVELGAREYALYAKLAQWLPSNRDETALQAELGLDAAGIERLCKALVSSGLLYDRGKIPAQLSGVEFHRDYFSKALPSWLGEAFSHPYWERMMEGRGSKRLFRGWMVELYHYTRNANRHMPLSVAHAQRKPVKALRAKHYAEEWNHYHYFMKSLKALGCKDPEIADRCPCR